MTVRFLRTVARQWFEDGRRVEVVDIDGEPGFAVVAGDEVVLAGTIEVDVPTGAEEPRIAGLRWVLNPDKLGWITLPER